MNEHITIELLFDFQTFSLIHHFDLQKRNEDKLQLLTFHRPTLTSSVALVDYNSIQFNSKHYQDKIEFDSE